MLFEEDNSVYTVRQENITKALSCKTLDELYTASSECKACDLCKTRKNIVFSNVKTRKDIMFIGEAPGKNEDETGLPFTGMAGKLLERALQAAGLSYDNVYICNILKCRPPENRDPSEEETLKCTPWLARQIQIVEPKIIVALGKHAAQFVFDEEGAMSQMRGRVKNFLGIPAIATWHPAFLLRREDKKEEFWEDLLAALKLIAPTGNTTNDKTGTSSGQSNVLPASAARDELRAT